MVEAGLGFGKLVKFLTTSRFDSLTTFFGSLKIGYNTVGAYNGQTYKIVTLFIVNIGGIIKGEFGVNQAREAFLLIAKIFHHNHAFRVDKNNNGKILLKRRGIFSSTLLLHPTSPPYHTERVIDFMRRHEKSTLGVTNEELEKL